MMLVDADAVEAHAIGEFELVEVIVVDAVAELRVVKVARDIHPNATILRGEVLWQIRVRHQMKRREFHRSTSPVSFLASIASRIRSPAQPPYFPGRLSCAIVAPGALLPLRSTGVKSTAAGIARSLSGSGCGDHLSSHSVHKPRMCGITSRANISVLLRTSSGGIDPICIRIIRWPQLRLFIASRKRSRTVLGEPAI